MKDSNDTLVGDIMKDDNYEYVKETQSNLDKLFKRPKQVVNISYNDINDTALIDKVLDNLENNGADPELENVGN